MALTRRKGLRRSRKPVAPLEGRSAWKEPHYGFCAVCGVHGRLVRHHVLYERKIRDAGRLDLVYDLRDSLDVGAREVCDCHYDHHRALRNNQPWRIPLRLVPDDAIAFTVDVLGSDEAAAVFFSRYYAQAA